jgi:hypothetical protein
LRHCSCRDYQKGGGRNEHQNKGTYGAIPNTSFDQLHGRRVHTNRARAVDHSVALDGLGEEGHWRGCLVGFDCFFENHSGGLDVNTSLLDLSCGCVESKLELFEMCVGMSFES